VRHLLIFSVSIVLASPLAAQPVSVEPVDEEIVRALPSQAELDALGTVFGRIMGAMMDVEIGGVIDAIDPEGGDAWKREERSRTIGSLAGQDDPYAKERMQRTVEVATSNMGDVMRDIAILTPRLRRTFEDVARDVEDATRDLPSR